MSVFWSEFFGTAVLMLLGVGVNANRTLPHMGGGGGGWSVTALGWGTAVFAGATVAGASGGHINPAVTLANAIAGVTAWGDVPAYLAGQFLGAALGCVLAYLAVKKHVDATRDKSNLVGLFATMPGIRSPWWNTVSELIATYALVLFVMISSAAGMTGPAGYAGAAAVIMAIGFGIGGTTGYSLNPARDLSARVTYALLPIRGKGPAAWWYAWPPVVGPVSGACAGALTVMALGVV